MKLIDKDKVVAEIENKLQDLIACKENALSTEKRVVLWAKIDMCNEILSFLDTLEVKEADLEKEINDYISNNFFGSQTVGFFAKRTKKEPNDQDIALCAKHFFELGLNANKGK